MIIAIGLLILGNPIPTLAYNAAYQETVIIERTLSDGTHELFTKKNGDYFRKTLKWEGGSWHVDKSEKITLPKTGLKRKTQIDPKDPQLAQDIQTKLGAFGYALGNLPSAVDYSASNYLPPIGEQTVNDCVAWATGYYLRSFQEGNDLKWSLITRGLPDNSHIFSPSFIYNQINGGLDTGAFLDDAGNLLKDVGADTLADFPYQAGDYLTQPNSVQKQAAYPHRIKDWRVLFTAMDSPDYIIQQTRQYLLTGDLPVIGVTVGFSFVYPTTYNGKSYITMDGSNLGGHAVAVVGYDDTIETPDGKGAFKIVNSWGKGWGNGGFGYITYSQFKNSVLEGAVFTDLVNPPPPPPPPLTPNLTSATYDVGSGNLVLKGTNFVKVNGSGNDIDVTKLTISCGENQTTLTSATRNVDITNPTSATLRVYGADKTALKAWVTRNGAGISSANPYNLSASAGWNSTDAPADFTDNPVTVSGNPGPVLQSGAYNVETGTLVLAATNLNDVLGEANDIDGTKLTLSAGSRNKVTLTSGSVDILSPTRVVLVVNKTDQKALKVIATQNGTSVLRVPYNLAVAAGWNGAGSKADTTGNPLLVSGNPPPALTSATYDVGSGKLVLTGTNFISVQGSYNDIEVTKLTISSGGKQTTLTSATRKAEITSPSSAIIRVGGTDKLAIKAWATRNGAGLTSTDPYNIAAAVSWNSQGALEELTDNPITITGNQKPTVSVVSATLPAGSDVKKVKSSKLGTVYLVPDSMNLTCLEEAEAAVQDGVAQLGVVTKPNAYTTIGTNGLTAGKYRVVGVDEAGNISEKSRGIITIMVV